MPQSKKTSQKLLKYKKSTKFLTEVGEGKEYRLLLPDQTKAGTPKGLKMISEVCGGENVRAIFLTYSLKKSLFGAIFYNLHILEQFSIYEYVYMENELFFFPGRECHQVWRPYRRIVIN